MLPNLFAPPALLIQGLFAGLLLGLFFCKARLSQFKVIVGQLILKDFTMAKVMLTAIIVGSIGIHLFLALDLPILESLKPESVLAIILGGMMLGIGMAILGYCPATCVAAAGQGSRGAWWGILGMLFGALAYAESYPLFKTHVIPKMLIQKTKLTEFLGLSPWIIIAILTIFAVVFFKLIGKKMAQPEKKVDNME